MLPFVGDGGLVEALGLNQDPSPAFKSIFMITVNNTHTHVRFVAPYLMSTSLGALQASINTNSRTIKRDPHQGSAPNEHEIADTHRSGGFDSFSPSACE